MNELQWLTDIQQEFPHIRAYEEDDLEWWNEGLDLLEANQLDEAETLFKKLTLSQPDQSDGFEGLAMVYTRKNDRTKAEFFYRQAIAKAEAMIQKGHADPAILEPMRAGLNKLSAQ